jgi:hypothetical protein
MKDNEMWFLFIVKLPCQLKPASLDQVSRRIATVADALRMEKQLSAL